MATYRIKLDTMKQTVPPKTVHAKEGDSGSCSIVAEITEDGAAYDFAGKSARLECLKPDGTKAVVSAEIDGSTVTCDVPSEVLAARGWIKCAYFAITEDGGTWRDTTDTFLVDVQQSAGGSLEPGDYVSEIDRTIAALRAQNRAEADQEAERQSEFDAAQTAREEAYGEAEKGRGDLYAAAESERTREFEANEEARQENEEERIAAEIKRKADFAEIVDAAQGLKTQILTSGQYDEDGTPTIEGTPGVIYLVPVEGPSPDDLNSYVEWMYLSGDWEVIGGTQTTVTAITTAEIDSVAAGEAPTGTSMLSLSGLSYLWAKLKAAFAAKSHKHGDADITAVSGSKLADASVSRAKLDAGLEADIAGLEDACDSVSQTQSGEVGWIPVSYLVRGGVCTVAFAKSVAFTIAGTDMTTVGQLPEGIRPATDVRSRMSIYWLPDVLDLVVTSSGEVKVSAPVADVNFDAHYCFGTLTFAIAP